MGFALLIPALLPVLPAIAQGFARERIVLLTASGEHGFDVEIADDEQKRSKGLMFRRALGDREGMLFLYDRPQFVSMWMQNTYISLDMVFIRKDGVVHRVEFATEPHSTQTIASGIEVTAVLEIKAGVAKEIGLKPGDRIQHRAFKS